VPQQDSSHYSLSVCVREMVNGREMEVEGGSMEDRERGW
jgi:hypothetical protein